MLNRITLGSTVVLDLLGDTAFYRSCPTYLFMMDNGLAVSRQYQELVRKQQKCKGCTERAIQGTLGTFALHTRTLARFDAKLLMPLLDYLSGKLGFKVDVVSLYYKDTSGAQKELRFGPTVSGLVSDTTVEEQGGSHGAVRSSAAVPASPPSGA